MDLWSLDSDYNYTMDLFVLYIGFLRSHGLHSFFISNIGAQMKNSRFENGKYSNKS